MIVNMKTIAVLEPRLYLPAPSNLFSVRKLSCLPLTSFPSKFVRLNAIANPTCDDQESDRPFKKLPPSPWTDHFHSLFIDVSEMDALRKEIEVLKQKVMNTLMSSQGIDSAKIRILTIYLLVSLGLAYHFEDEIDETLKESFEKIEEMMAGEEDLYTVSIIFWVFRRYAHHISSDVFRRFKGNNGKFKQSLIGDVKGMLSLYEAAHLGTTKDYIMHEALSFTSSHLKSLAIGVTCPPHLSKRIQQALILPQHWNMDIIVPVEYISFYEQEKDHNQMLLKFAKLNFKFLQLQYIQELKSITKWYKEQEFASKFPPYFRDRIVENYFFALSPFFEPQQSRARRIVTKCFTALQILDDTFDRYASLPEAESFAKSLIRWAPDHTMDKQPAYLKSALNSILDIFEELRNEHRPEGRSYSVDATIDEYKESAKANFDLAKWALVGHVPSFEEYMKVGAVEVQVLSTIAIILLAIGKMGTKEAHEWLKSRPKLVQSISIRGRLRNDITGFEDDMSRGYVTNAVNCYMKQYGVSKEEAFRELNKIVVDADKITNEEFLTTIDVPHCVLKAVIDHARMITVTYNVNDGYTDPRGKVNEYMMFMFVDQIRL